ncbi:MAG: LytTR family transcriptional regulator DNA-binding domain-containing protein [Lachnospiraceae bacterium]|nr:LytTR family transcriptional regulator DNA-binding domain-containing protein [Lachnospiraceae bacterium]MBO5144751.1 LytTR family transcriptional regulator DNA-binding domain-containing protein [Lachnospiraceae bacterium]
MIQFAFCWEREDELDFMTSEIRQCFRQKGISIAFTCFRSAHELLQCIPCNCPDILFCDLEGENGLMRKAAIAARRENKNLIIIVKKSRSYVPQTEDVLLEPMYVMPDASRKHLWSYAASAYEAALDDGDSFSYYVRPDYIHIPISEIHYFASEGRRTHVVSGEYRDTFYQKLDVVERLIRHKNGMFLRIHKSYLVNAKYIAGYNRDYVALTTGEKLRISRYEYYKILNERFQHSRVKRCPLYEDITALR